MVIPSKGLNTSMYIMTKRSTKKQKARFAITDITNQDFRKLLKKFKDSPYLGYKSKQVHNGITEDYFFQIKNITKRIKSERRVISHFLKLGVNETIGRINIKIGHFNEAIQSEELDSNNETYKCRDKYKQILSAHDINGEEKTLSTSKKKENVRDGYVRIYECGKLFFI